MAVSSPSRAFFQDSLDGEPRFVGNETFHEVLAHDLVFGVSGQTGGCLVPLVDEAVGIDSDDWGVGGINETDQVLCRVLLLGACRGQG